MSNVRKVRVEWTGDSMEFRGGGVEPRSPAVMIDGDGRAGPSPMQTLLLAAAGCTGSDVVHILGKMRQNLQALSIEVEGVRRVEDPKRYVSVHLRFEIGCPGLQAAQAQRVVELSVSKYCSVLHTFAPDVEITHEITLA